MNSLFLFKVFTLALVPKQSQCMIVPLEHRPPSTGERGNGRYSEEDITEVQIMSKVTSKFNNYAMFVTAELTASCAVCTYMSHRSVCLFHIITPVL